MLAKILIIDDEYNYANLLKAFLEEGEEESNYNYQIEIASSVEEAIGTIDKYRPDLILTDLRLDVGLEGLDIFDYLKKQNLDIPAGIVTAYGDKENILKCLAKRPYFLFEKSGQIQEIKAKIKEILRERERKSHFKADLVTARSCMAELPSKDSYQLLVERLESLNSQQSSDLLTRLSELNKTRENKKQNKASVISPEIIEKGNVYILKPSYTSKTTGETKSYDRYFTFRWVDEKGKNRAKYLGKYEDIKDPSILEKLHSRYPEFENKIINKG